MKKVFLVSLLSLFVLSLVAQAQEKQRQKDHVKTVLTQQGKVAATPTPTPVSEDKKVISNGKGKMPPYGKEAVRTPTPGDERDLKGSTKETEPTPDAAKKMTPAPKVDSIQLNSSRANVYRARPTVTPTPRKK